MANYHFHFQQQEEGHREDVRPPLAPLVPLVSPYIATLLEESSFHGFQHRVRPTQALHIATLAARPSRPHRHRQSFRSRSTSTCRSRSRRRRKTQRSRSSSPRSHRRRARSCSPSRRSRTSRATRTAATQMSPISSAFYPENPQYPAAAFSAPPSTFVALETVASAKASPEVVPAVLSPCHPRPQVVPPQASPFHVSTLQAEGPTPPAPGQHTSFTTPAPPPPPSPFPPPPPPVAHPPARPPFPPPPPPVAHPPVRPPSSIDTSVTRPAHPAKSPSVTQLARTAPPPPPPPPPPPALSPQSTAGPQSSKDSGPMTSQMLANTVAMSNAGPISACDPQGVAAALAIRRASLTETTLNAMMQKDADDNEFANFWQLPDFQLQCYYVAD